MQRPTPRDLVVPGVLIGVATLRALQQAFDYALLGPDTLPLVLGAHAESLLAWLHALVQPLLVEEFGPVHHRPVLQLSIALDHRLYGLSPYGYHLSSALLFAASAFALHHLARTLGISAFGAAVAAAWLLLHPVQLSILPVPARRTDTLCLLFTALAVASQVRAVRRRRAFAVGPALFSALAVGSKETGYVALVLCVAAVLLYAPGSRAQRLAATAKAAAPLLLALGLLLALRVTALDEVIGERPIRSAGYARSLPVLLGRLLGHSLSARAILPRAPLPIAPWAVVVVAGGVAFLAGGAERRRRIVAALGRPLLLGVIALWGVAMLYAVGVILLPWYLLIPVAALAWCIGATAEALWALVRDARSLARGAAAVGLVALAAALAVPALHSPLLGRHDDWQRASQLMRDYLAALDARVAASQPGERLVVPPPPVLVPRRPGEPHLRGVVVLSDSSVRAWLHLRFPDLPLRVEELDPTPKRPDPRMRVIAFARDEDAAR